MQNIIQTARELDAEGFDSEMGYEGPGRFEATDNKEMAVALDIISGHGFADQEAGSVEYGLNGARVDRFVLWTDDRGFKTLQEYESVEAATMALDNEDDHQNSVS